MTRRDRIASRPRRALLVGLSAALALPDSGGAAAAGETRILKLLRQWRALQSAMNETHGGLSEAEMDLLIERQEEIEDQMMALPSVHPSDFAAKLLVCCNDREDLLGGSFRLAGALFGEAQGLVGND